MAHQLEQLTGALAARYRVEHEIGRGGMATVYLARDLKHDRSVAHRSRARLRGSKADQVIPVAGPLPFRDIINMASRLFDFSHLTPDERIELAEQLWDSLSIEAVGPDEEQLAELLRRRAELHRDGNPGRPWKEVLDELESSGA